MLATAAIVAAALLLRWPALQAGFHSDDYAQAAMLEGRFWAPRAAHAMYDFGGRDAGEARRLREAGWFPWWSAPDLRLAMFRPVSSWLLAAEHAAFGLDPAPRHALSAAWMVALLLGVAATLRLLLAPGAALLGLAVFAADASLSVPLAWLANRNALVSAAFGMWAVYAYLRFRREARRDLAGLSAVLGAAAIFAGEYAVPLLAYPLAYEWLVSSERRALRLTRSALVLALAAVPLAAGVAFGYGNAGSGLYVSPLHAPFRYLEAAHERLPALAAELLAGVPAGTRLWARGDAAFRIGIALLALLLVLGAARVARLRLGPEPRVLLVASLLALPLLAGALPEARLLTASAFGLAGVVAVVVVALASVVRGPAPTARRTLAALLALAICIVHLGVEPVRALVACELLRARAAGHSAWSLAAETGGPQAADREWIVVAARDFTTAQILPFARALHGLPLPRAYRLLSTAASAHELVRRDARTLELRVLDDRSPAFVGSLHRASSLPFRGGERIDAGAIRVVVEDVRNAQPVRMRFEFPHDLNGGHYLFLHPAASGLRPIALPAVGNHMRLPPPHAPRIAPRF